MQFIDCLTFCIANKYFVFVANNIDTIFISELFPCEVCFKIYRSKVSWYFHKRYECGKPHQFFCDNCSYSTRRKGDFKRHVTRVHKIPLSELLV